MLRIQTQMKVNWAPPPQACCLCCILRSDISHLESQTVLLQIMSSRNLCLYIALSYALTSRKMRVAIYGLQVRVIRVIPETCIENDSLRMNGLADGQHRVC